MKQLTKKWKLFLITNYVLLVFEVIAILGLILVIATAKSSDKYINAYLVFGLLFLLVFANNTLNIYIINKFFPNNPLPKRPKILLVISTIIFIPIIAFVGMVCYFFLSYMYEDYRSADVTDYLGGGFAIILLILSLFTLILQFQIPRYLNRKSKGSIESLIESIGT